MRADPALKQQNIPAVLEPNAETPSTPMVAQRLNTHVPPPSMSKSRRFTAELMLPESEAQAAAIPAFSPGQPAVAAKKRKRAQIQLELEALEVQQKRIALKKQLMELDDE